MGELVTGEPFIWFLLNGKEILYDERHLLHSIIGLHINSKPKTFNLGLNPQYFIIP